MTTQNSHITSETLLTSAETLKKTLPCSTTISAQIDESRKVITRLISGEDKRLFVIAGPCTVHDPQAALDYAAKLLQLSQKVDDKIYIAMRVNFEKPRTTVGWPGLINDPDINGSYNIEKGLKLARETLLKINELGMPCATEYLDAVVPQYTSDLISWAAIGQRTTESPTHRHMASGLSMPLGFKNATDGGIESALGAMHLASLPQKYLGLNDKGMTTVFSTTGHNHTHLLMRGVGNKSNYSKADLSYAKALLEPFGKARQIMVDCSHGGGGKNYLNQPRIFGEVLSQFRAGNTSILGLLIESHLVEGRQDLSSKPLIYGQSITDGCLGFKDTEAVILGAYQQI